MQITIGGGIDWPAWVQAVGSILAVAAGFIYVGLQRYHAVRDQRRQEHSVRSHYSDVIRAVSRSIDQRCVTFRNCYEGRRKVGSIAGRDSLDVLGDELLTVSPIECGSSDFSAMSRQAGLYAKTFAHICLSIAAKDVPPDAQGVADLELHREGFADAAKRILAEAERLEK